MSTLAIKPNPVAVDVFFSEHDLHVILADGRQISAPISWFPRLQNASKKELDDWRLIGDGLGIHWEAVDEDIAISTLLALK